MNESWLTETLALEAAKRPDRTWAPPPRQVSAQPISVGKAGFAEIKPHRLASIAEGMRQLRKKDGEGRAGRTGQALVTYLPMDGAGVAVARGNPASVRVYAVNLPAKQITGAQLLDGYQWYQVGSFVPKKAIPLVVEDPSIFGMAIERPVRALFYARVIRPNEPKIRAAGGWQSGHGADVYWDELASFYAELAGEMTG